MTVDLDFRHAGSCYPYLGQALMVKVMGQGPIMKMFLSPLWIGSTLRVTQAYFWMFVELFVLKRSVRPRVRAFYLSVFKLAIDSAGYPLNF